MDRRSWLWRRKSSDKSTGETESSGSLSGSGSGSLSSPSERFSDDQQAYANQITQSPEVTSKAVLQDEDVNDSLKILTEKLSDALANVSAKEELVQQHAKVAEEAVTGWEKAEKEATILKQQLDAATKKNSSLEDRIVHLDGALKECLRQLRQVREEQDQKIQEAIAKKSEDSESKSSNDVETQLADLRAQLETANAKIEANASLESDLRLRLGSTEKENASLQLKLRSLLEELEIRTLERDLSTKTAETASKQHLESIKKVAKLEAECRRLKSMARKATSFNNQKLLKDPPSHVDRFKLEKSPTMSSMTPSDDIGFMDDFLEMERLAALPVRENTPTVKHNGNGEAPLMENRTVELEKKIEMLEVQKEELGEVLTKHQDQLKLSEAGLGQLQTKFNECENQLKISQAQLKDANNKLGMLQAELDLANDLRQAIELELEDANMRKEEAESQLNSIKNEREILLSKVNLLEGEAEKERARYAEISAKCQALEDEVSRMKREAETQEGVEREIHNANANREEAESQLSVVKAEAKSLLDKCRRLEEELSRVKQEVNTLESRLTFANNSKEAVERELEMSIAQKDAVESQLRDAEAEAKSLLAKVGLLEHEVEKERALSADFSTKCKKLQDELSKMKCGAEFRLAPKSKEELDIEQEKELVVAATKLAECQKTIASLGKQLKSLATFDDLFLDSDKVMDVSEKESQLLQNRGEPANSPSGNKVSVESGALSSETSRDSCSGIKNVREQKKEGKEGFSSIKLDKSQKNGFGKLFPRSKSAMRSRNS